MREFFIISMLYWKVFDAIYKLYMMIEKAWNLTVHRKSLNCTLKRITCFVCIIKWVLKSMKWAMEGIVCVLKWSRDGNIARVEFSLTDNTIQLSTVNIFLCLNFNHILTIWIHHENCE